MSVIDIAALLIDVCPPTVVPVAQQPPSDYEVITNLEVAVRALVLQYHKSTKVRSVVQGR